MTSRLRCSTTAVRQAVHVSTTSARPGATAAATDAEMRVPAVGSALATRLLAPTTALASGRSERWWAPVVRTRSSGTRTRSTTRSTPQNPNGHTTAPLARSGQSAAQRSAPARAGAQTGTSRSTGIGCP
jgi:hypothetical protein